MRAKGKSTIVASAAAALFTGLLGLALAVEGGWLVSVGGTPAYLIAGIGYLVIGGLLIARIGAAF
jgi:quinoprotein glucose dehydrogenase